MRTAFKGLVAAATLAVTGLVAGQPAEARDGFSQVQYYGGGYPTYGAGYGRGYYVQPQGYAYGYGDRGYYRGDDRRWRHHHRDRWNDGWRGRGWRDRDWRRDGYWR